MLFKINSLSCIQEIQYQIWPCSYFITFISTRQGTEIICKARNERGKLMEYAKKGKKINTACLGCGVCLTYFISRGSTIWDTLKWACKHTLVWWETTHEVKTKPKVREPCNKILINCLHWKTGFFICCPHIHLRGGPFLRTVFLKRTMFICRWVGVLRPSGCSFGKSEKIRTP